MTPYSDAVLSALPAQNNLRNKLLSLRDNTHLEGTRNVLEDLLRFSLGGTCPSSYTEDEWTEAQSTFQTQLDSINPSLKRLRKDESQDCVPPKKARLTAPPDAIESSEPLFTLHAMSVTSPIRKKVDIIISSSHIQLTRDSSVEACITLSSITRAFLVPNLGKNKNKPHWTIILLSSDSWDRKKDRSDPESQVQFIFSVDATPKELIKTTTHPEQILTHPKGSGAYEHLHTFLSFLPPNITLIEASVAPSFPSTSRKESQPGCFCSTSGHPYVDAYRAAKEGSLYFFDEGILWGEQKPCEFIPLEEIAASSDGGGVKTLSATGRSFSLFVRKKAVADDTSDAEQEQEEGEELEFSLIDGKEQDNVLQWIRKFRHQFGKKQESLGPVQGISSRDKGKGKAIDQNGANGAESDASDEDFEMDSDSDGGSPTSGSEESEDDAKESEEEAEDSNDDGDGDEEELDPKHHPLLRPGAMPKMTQAAMSAVVAMMEQDAFRGDDDDGDAEDELDE